MNRFSFETLLIRYPAVTPELLIRFYEQYANDNRWRKATNGDAVMAGRGASRLE